MENGSIISGELQTLVIINGATLLAIVGVGFKVVRFLNTMEFKVDILWKDYESRQANRNRPQMITGFNRNSK